MTQVVYSCKGPYEDFVYAASFDKKNGLICTPKYEQGEQLFGPMKGYSKERQTYYDSDLRAFVYLVESSYDKEPNEKNYGQYAKWDNQGHINRNLMMITTLADITSPVLSVTDILVGTYSKAVRNIKISLKIDGCINLDHLDLFYNSDLNQADQYQKIDLLSNKAQMTKLENINQIQFVTLEDLTITSQAYFYFSFSCDKKEWSKDTKPESHLVRLRTTEYVVEKNGFSAKNQSEFKTPLFEVHLPQNLNSDSKSYIMVGNLAIDESRYFLELTSTREPMTTIKAVIQDYNKNSGVVELKLQFDPLNDKDLLKKAKFGGIFNYLTYYTVLKKETFDKQQYGAILSQTCVAIKKNTSSSAEQQKTDDKPISGSDVNQKKKKSKKLYECNPDFVLEEKWETIMNKKNQLRKTQTDQIPQLSLTLNKNMLLDIAGQIIVLFDQHGNELYKSAVQVKNPYAITKDASVKVNYQGAYFHIKAIFSSKFNMKINLSIAKLERINPANGASPHIARIKISIDYDQEFLKFMKMNQQLALKKKRQILVSFIHHSLKPEKNIDIAFNFDYSSKEMYYELVKEMDFKHFRMLVYGQKLQGVRIQSVSDVDNSVKLEDTTRSEERRVGTEC